MKQKIIQSLVMALSSLVLLGCGGSSDNNDDPKVTLTGTGYYVDSAVAGVEYVCGTKSGTTDSSGEFVFDIGSGCVFKVAGVTLRETSSDKLKDKVTIFENNETVARFLQSIDNDGNTSNGIQIDAKILNTLTNALKEHNSENKIPQDDTLTNVVDKVKEVPEFKGDVKSKEEVKAHLDKTEATLLKDELSGKTFYFRDKGDTKEIKFNADVTTLTITTVTGSNTEGNGEERIKLENNRVLLLDDGNRYIMLNDKKADYLMIDFYLPNGEKDGDTGRLYFDKAKAESSNSDSSTPSTDTPSNINIVDLLAGKTVYIVHQHIIESSSFNADMSVITWENVYGEGEEGQELGDKGTVPVSVADNKIIVDGDEPLWVIEDNIDYIVFTYGTTDTAKAYKDLEKAKAYYESMKSGLDTPAPTTTDFQSEIAGKTFYHIDNELIKEIKINADITTMTVTTIVGSNTDGNGEQSVKFENNKIVLLDEDNMYMTLNQKTIDYLLLDFYSPDGIKGDDGRFYFDLAKAEADLASGGTTSTTTDFKSEIAGKTFYILDMDNGVSIIKTIIFNSDVTIISGTKIDGTKSISLVDNKLILLDDDNMYFMLKEKTTDYLLLDFYSHDGIKDGDDRFYFDKAKAEVSLSGGGSGQTANIDPSILAGKTFYFVSELMVESDTFNEDMTLVTWENIYGVGDSNKVLGNKGTSSFHVEDNKAIFDKGGYFHIQEMTDTFVIFWDGTKQMKYYLNLDEAKAVYESMKSGSTSTTTPTGTDFKAELAGKTFYFIDNQLIKEIKFNADLTTMTFTPVVSYDNDNWEHKTKYEDNKLILLDADNKYFVFNEKKADYLLLDVYSSNESKIETNMFYFDKAKAEASLNGGGSTPDAVVVPTTIPVTQDMLDGKKFYFTSEEETYTEYRLWTFENGVLSNRGQNKSSSTVRTSTDTYTLSDGKILVNDESKGIVMGIVLNRTDSNAWYTSIPSPDGPNNKVMYLTKPSNYPAEL